MARPLLRHLQTLVPFWGDGWQQDVPLRTLRMALVCIVGLTPAYGAAYQVAVPEAYDPVAARLVLVLGALGLLIATYWVPVVRSHPRVVLAVVLHGVLLWFGYLVAANDLEAHFAIGYLFVDLSAVLVYSLVWDRPGPVARLVVVACAIGTVAAVVADPGAASLSPLVFLLVIASGSAIVFSALNGRLKVALEFQRSEARLAQAEALAQTGAWSLDLRTGQRTWSEGTPRILGLDPAHPPTSIIEFIHPDDLDALLADKARLFAGTKTDAFRSRIVRPDGEVRTVRGVVRVGRDAAGAAVRVDGVFLDVTEETAYAEALEAARDAAEAASRAKDEFLANMSHEIRTPLASIIGYAQILRDATDGENEALVEPIEAGGHRLLATLNSVLDLARIEAGFSQLALVPLDLGPEVEEVARLLRPQAERKGLSFHVEADGTPVQVLADAPAFGRALTNLIGNAVKFTDAGAITVALREVGGQADVVVSDTGRGIDPATADALFEPFRQASTGWGRSHEGTGLGLTITRRLVEAMHGTVRVESDLGEGARFTISLPLAPSGDGALSSHDPGSVRAVVAT